MGISRAVGATIIAFIMLVTFTPVLQYFIVSMVDQYVVQTLLPPSTIQQDWNMSLQLCNAMRPPNATWTCQERLAQYSLATGIDFNYTGYLANTTPFLPYKNSWFANAFSTPYLLVTIILSLVFGGIAEAGGRQP